MSLGVVVGWVVVCGVGVAVGGGVWCCFWFFDMGWEFCGGSVSGGSRGLALLWLVRAGMVGRGVTMVIVSSVGEWMGWGRLFGQM